MTFGEEGTPSGYDTHLFVVNNTIVNDLGTGTFVADPTPTPAIVTNNILTGGGTPSSQAGAVLTTNFTGDPSFVGAAGYDLEYEYGLATDAGVVGADAEVPDAASGGATDAGRDGGAGPSGGGGRCGCRAGADGSGGRVAALGALALVAAVVFRRRSSAR